MASDIVILPPSGVRPTGREVRPQPVVRSGLTMTRRRLLFNQELMRAVSVEDFQQIVEKVKILAKAGERWAVEELLNRLLGKPPDSLEKSKIDEEVTERAINYDGMTDEELNELDALEARRAQLISKAQGEVITLPAPAPEPTANDSQ